MSATVAVACGVASGRGEGWIGLQPQNRIAKVISDLNLLMRGSLIEQPDDLRSNWQDRTTVTSDTDLHVQWAKLETEFLELNLLADRNPQWQLEAVRVAFDCEMALLDRMPVPERRTVLRNE